jgi:hypothetical protein
MPLLCKIPTLVAGNSKNAILGRDLMVRLESRMA